MRQLVCAGLLGLAGVLASPTGTAAPAVHVAGELRPAVLSRLESIEGLTAVAIAEGGRQAAYARVDADRPERSKLGLVDAGGGEPVESDLPGVVRDLAWIDGQSRLLGIVFRPARHREGTTDLLEIDPTSARSRRVLRLAPSARSLERLPGTPLLLLAARDGVRTVRLPDLRSGPLYRVPGENLSLAWLDGTRVLIGRADGLTLVDLDDPPGEEGLPVRAHVPSPGPVVGLAAAADGRIEARLADGRLFGVELAPLRLVDRGEETAALARLSAPSGDRVAPRVARGTGDPPPPPTEPASPAPSRPTTPLDVTPTTPRPAERAEPPPAQPASPPLLAPPPAHPLPSGAPTPPLAAPGARGRIEGPAAAAARAVVLLGPDNILRRSVRVTPRDGAWSAGGLVSGRYRVQVEGGPETVLVCDPPFVTVEVSDGVVDAPTIRVLRAM